MLPLLPTLKALQASEHVLISAQFLAHLARGVIILPQVRHALGEREESVGAGPPEVEAKGSYAALVGSDGGGDCRALRLGGIFDACGRGVRV